ncbi:MAG: hypothetical protein BroJett011_63260 [Chloroflexota bacterium]|nr:MAG: hypothetical protein BroJett011_63260 [Chloroflexota bacterium]
MFSVVLLPANLLATQRFHHDEALYATWALQITSGTDPWLVVTPIDKPPLFIYVIAGTMKLLGATEAAVRLPSLLATALTVGLTFGLGRRVYGPGVGVLAAWLVALSPFTLLFAPTAFTDPLMVALVLTACLAAVHGRAGWAGVALGLAIATKQQGLFFALLVLGLLTIYDLRFTIYDLRPVPRPGVFTHHASRITHHASHFILSTLLTLLSLLVWTLTRAQAPNFLTYSLANYGGLTSDAASFGERWWGFVELLAYGTASPLLNGIFIAGLPLLLGYGLWRGARGRGLGAGMNFQPSNLPTFPSITDWLLALFTLAFLLGHALFSFQVWDRYLLGLIPFLALLLARILWLPRLILPQIVQSWVTFHRRDVGEQRFFKFDFLCVSVPLCLISWRSLISPIYGLSLATLLMLTLARPVQDAVNGRYPLGSHSQALAGIEQIVAYLQGHAGANHTLYHRWLGTHWRFYLWGYPYDLQVWASPQQLAANAKPGHLIAFPSWQSDTEARLALAEEGLALKELTRAYNPAGYPSMVLYEIVKNE